jgi:WD40 repeat protein
MTIEDGLLANYLTPLMTPPAGTVYPEKKLGLARRALSQSWVSAIVMLLLINTAARLAIAQNGPSPSNSDGNRANNVPLLALDPEGHNGWVVELLRYSYQNQLISISHDKTIRFWSLDTGEPLRVLRPPKDRGDAGRLCAGAISPDETLLAVGGFAALRDSRDCRVMLISLPEGQLVRTLTGHTLPIRTLSFSPDGSRLASGGDDGVVRLHDPKTGALLQKLVGHTDRVYGLAWSPDGKRLLSGSWDRTGRIWSASGQPLLVLAGHTRDIITVDWSKDGRLLATGATDNSIRLWNADGSLRYVWPKLDNHLSLVAFSPDSRQLLYGWGSRDKSIHGTGVLDVATGQERLRFSGHPNTPMCGQWLPDSNVVTGSAQGDIRIWSPDDGKPVRRLISRGRSVAAAGWSPDGRAVAWGYMVNRGTLIKGTVPLQFSFCLESLDFGPPPDGSFVHSREFYGDLHVQRTSNSVASVWRNGQRVSQYRLTHPDDRIRCRSILSGDRAVVGSDYGTVVFNVNTGRAIYGLPGHSDMVEALSPSPNDRYLLSGSLDQTMEIWNTDTYEHLASLFFAGSEWIVWTPKGYYAASVGGERLMGWHVNRGPDALADYYPAANFRDSLYRPDVIRRLVDSGSFNRAWHSAEQEREQSREPLTISAVLPPQVSLKKLDVPGAINAAGTKLSVTAISSGKDPIRRLRLIVDGRPGDVYSVPQNGSRSESEAGLEIQHDFLLRLIPGAHIITAKADTDASYGLSSPLELAVSPERAARPKLYVLAIGIGNYQSPAWRIEHAAQDAVSLAKVFSAAQISPYSAIETHVLTNEQATRVNVLDALAAMQRRMTPDDVGIVFLEGRGGNDTGGEFRFFTGNPLPGISSSGNIIARELKTFAQQTPGRLMFWADIRRADSAVESAETNYCQSQMATTQQRGSFGLDDFLREMADPDHGVIVIGAGSGSATDRPNASLGIFAEAVIASLSLSTESPVNRDIQLNEFEASVSNRVSELSEGRQHTVNGKPPDIHSFPLWRPQK